MKLTTLTKTWNGTEYHCVNVRTSYWDYTENQPKSKVMHEWCENLFGPQGDPWDLESSARWYHNDSKFWFREERSRTLFMLRWSHG